MAAVKPMKCDVCDKEATVFLTQIINGQMTTVNLCESCSKEKGVTDETGFGLAEAFLGGQSSVPPQGRHYGGANLPRLRIYAGSVEENRTDGLP